MSSRPIICCRQCKSFRVEPLPRTRLRGRRPWFLRWAAGMGILPAAPLAPPCYVCRVCACQFEVNDAAVYAGENPPEIDRCMKCDQKTMTLVERNRRHKFQP